ncbi:MAG: hypothetical protein QOG89_2218 [Thermomicrobiales bacterium]|nr:hypothetical protein [Thermomicrobiales bacterium]
MTTTGNLRDFGVADLLQMLALRRHTGRLTITTDEIEVVIFVDEGRLALATASDPGLRLGQMLVGRKVLRASRLRAALREQAQSNESRSLGEILVEHGWVQESDLAHGLHEQAVAVLSRLLDAEEGSFFYHRLVTPPPHIALLPLPADRILLEAARRVDELLTSRPA